MEAPLTAARLAWLALLVWPALTSAADDLSKPYVEAVRALNQAHLNKPAKMQEEELKKKLPRAARAALEKLLTNADGAATFEALVAVGEAALDLDLVEDFERIATRLEKSSPEQARKLGAALSRPRFLLRGLGGLDKAYLEGFSEVLEAVLSAYDELFGFEEWSKLPGKKLRVRVHLEDRIERPPHFAPQFPFHSEIDFPVVDPKELRSPTADGKFLFYGLCHELGHLIAMWGNARLEEDRHSWAHYTGVAIVEHLSEKAKDKPFMGRLKDLRWQSLSKERERLKTTKPSLGDKDGVLALLIALHDQIGSKAIGAAINLLDRQNKRLRINQVRYYTFKELEQGLLATLKDAAKKKSVAELIPDAAK